VSQLGVFFFCAAMGFVMAATISSFYQWVTSERADFMVARTSALGLVMAVMISMFCGPFIIMRHIVMGFRARELRALPAMLGVVVAGMWSVCAGIFYVSLLLTT
jgi:hypothetical protein